MKYILLLILLSVSLTASAQQQIWFSSGYSYTGDKHDLLCVKGRCTELDTRIRFPFEVTLVNEHTYMEFGWFNAYDENASFTHAGGGVVWQPFKKATRLFLQLGFLFGRETSHSDEVMRFKVSPSLQFDKWRIGWAHVSNARHFANLGNSSNEKIEWITFGYCAAGCD